MGFTKKKISFRLCMPSCFFLLLLVSNMNTDDNLPPSEFNNLDLEHFGNSLKTLFFLLPSSIFFSDVGGSAPSGTTDVGTHSESSPPSRPLSMEEV